MPIFSYSAKTAKGERIEGSVEANDRRQALLQVERLGHMPISIREGAAPLVAAPAAKPAFRFTLNPHAKQRLSQRELLTFSMELSDLLASGMTLGHALTTLANRRSGRAGDAIIRKLRDDVIGGASLSAAMSHYPDSFSQLYISMIRVGEATGALGEVMQRLVAHYERLQEVREKVIMALVYPAIVLFLGIVTLVFSMVFVIPKFSMIFQELHGTLPLPTRVLIGLSRFMVRFGWALLAVLALAAVAANRAVKQPKGRLWWHGFQLRVPLIRNIIAASSYASLARTLGTLLSNGVPALQALGIVEQTMVNVVIANEIRKARERVTDGTTISGPLAAGKVFPPLMTDMLAIGEQTGDMSGALGHIARRYETELDRSVKIFTTALEPLLIVLVAVLVGFVAVSILMAVFSLTNGLNV
jgi:type II secretory pathway component PulF